MKARHVPLTALGLLLLAEFALVLPLRGLSYSESWQARDPVAGAVYVALLGSFAVMLLLVPRS